MPQFGLAIRVAERQSHQEAVELALGQAIRALLLDRVLGGDDHEGLGQHVAGAIRADLSFLHRLEQC